MTAPTFARCEPQRCSDLWEVWLYRPNTASAVAEVYALPMRSRRLCVCDNDADALEIAARWNRMPRTLPAGSSA